MKRIIALLLSLSMLAACSSQPNHSSQSSENTASNPEPLGEELSSVSNITSVENVPLLTLNNGTQVPQLGLGTQIQRLEGDASEEGRQLLNDTSHDAVVAALQSGYRHLDTAHGYYNETGVGQAIIDSDVPREEIWVPASCGQANTAKAQRCRQSTICLKGWD